MEITYDKDADAMYIKFINGRFSKNQKIDDLTMIDLDENGQILGIELLDASKRMSLDSLSKIKVKV